MTSEKSNESIETGGLMAEMLAKESKPSDRSKHGQLLEEPSPAKSPEAERFNTELTQTLKSTEEQVLDLVGDKNQSTESKGWGIARQTVEAFQPVPWFIWRLSNFVFGGTGEPKQVSEGFVLGLRRLLFAASSDPVLGTGTKVNKVPAALKVLESDVVAAISVIHAVCRKLASRPYERIWKPMVDDALIRAQIGFRLGKASREFSTGKCMLAGFAGRCGLAVQIACGELDQARRTLEMLAGNDEIKKVGLQVYSCEPLQVSAMILSASGCGRDAAFGTASYSLQGDLDNLTNEEQKKWRAAFAIVELLRMNKSQEVDPALWQLLGCTDEAAQLELADESKKAFRRGHGWPWLL